MSDIAALLHLPAIPGLWDAPLRFAPLAADPAAAAVAGADGLAGQDGIGAAGADGLPGPDGVAVAGADGLAAPATAWGTAWTPPELLPLAATDPWVL